MAEEGKAPAAEAGQPAPAPEAPKGSTGLEEYAPVVEYAKQIPGLTPEMVMQSVRLTGTKEGQAELIARIEQQFGDQIALRRLATNPALAKQLDRDKRRAVRRSVATKQEIEDGAFADPDDDAPDTPNPAEEARAAAKAAEERASRAEAVAMTTADAMRIAPTLSVLANKNQVIADNMEEWQTEVMGKLTGNDPRYAGFTKAHIERASEAVLNEWKRTAERLGYKPPAPPTPAASATVAGPKVEDIQERFKAARTHQDPERRKAAILEAAAQTAAELEGIAR